MTYNGETIPVPELEGLELGAMKKSAHVQIYDGFSKNKAYPDLACLWINGKTYLLICQFVEFILINATDG